MSVMAPPLELLLVVAPPLLLPDPLPPWPPVHATTANTTTTEDDQEPSLMRFTPCKQYLLCSRPILTRLRRHSGHRRRFHAYSLESALCQLDAWLWVLRMDCRGRHTFARLAVSGQSRPAWAEESHLKRGVGSWASRAGADRRLGVDVQTSVCNDKPSNWWVNAKRARGGGVPVRTAGAVARRGRRGQRPSTRRPSRRILRRFISSHRKARVRRAGAQAISSPWKCSSLRNTPRRDPHRSHGNQCH